MLLRRHKEAEPVETVEIEEKEAEPVEETKPKRKKIDKKGE